MAGFTFALCADDYAMTPGVSRGILEALAADALSATSVMTTTDGWQEAATALRRFDGRVDIGLHLNLTVGRPVGAMPRLAPQGTLPTIGTMMRAAHSGTLPLDEVAAEIGQQLDGFAAAFGRAPDHVDGHQHVHTLPGVRAVLLAALAERAWRPWLRDSSDRAHRILRRRATLAKAATVAVVARGLAADSRRAGLWTNNGFAGFSSFTAAEPFRAEFERFLIAPGTAHLVMCHPGYVDDALRRLDPVLGSRERELAFLLSADSRELLARTGATLGRMSSLLAAPTRFKEA